MSDSVGFCPAGGGKAPKGVNWKSPSLYVQLQTSELRFSEFASMVSHKWLYAARTLLWTASLEQKSGADNEEEEQRASWRSRPAAVIASCQLQTTVYGGFVLVVVAL
jgi:hypothetical protein